MNGKGKIKEAQKMVPQGPRGHVIHQDLQGAPALLKMQVVALPCMSGSGVEVAVEYGVGQKGCYIFSIK